MLVSLAFFMPSCSERERGGGEIKHRVGVSYSASDCTDYWCFLCLWYLPRSCTGHAGVLRFYIEFGGSQMRKIEKKKGLTLYELIRIPTRMHDTSSLFLHINIMILETTLTSRCR